MTLDDIPSLKNPFQQVCIRPEFQVMQAGIC